MERQFTDLNFQIVIEPKIIESTFNLWNGGLTNGLTLKTFLYVFHEKNLGGTLNFKTISGMYKKT